MIARENMPDVVVLIPGITGSILRKNGRTVWGFAPGSLARALLTQGGSLEDDLMLPDDPADRDDVGDGVYADALIDTLHLLPGLWKINGYTRIAEMIRFGYDVNDRRNFFVFPYDWRRGNRVSARKLARCTHEWLNAWRQRSGNSDARLILIAHSMGGLVARYFLECMDGWKKTRALITFGTPYRGSLNALDTLANGLHYGPRGLIDLSRAARSFTSVYQLLPIYPCYDSGCGELSRIGETSGIPNVDSDKAAAALAFHREIEEAAKANREAASFIAEGYRVYPVIGIAQVTHQSARLSGNRVEMVPSHAGTDYGGDGTVSRVSAEPLEFGADNTSMFAGTKHSSIQNSDAVLIHLRGLINRFYFDLGDFRWGQEGPGIAAKVGRISLQVPDLLFADEPLHVQVRPDRGEVRLELIVRSSNGEIVRRESLQTAENAETTVEMSPLPHGAYTIRVAGRHGGVEPAEDAFAVGDSG